jgi:hypothetical protein
VRTRLTALADLSDRDVGAWRDLAARAVEPNPFLEPDLVLPAEARLGDGKALLLTVEDGSEWAACLPVEAVRWHGWRLPVLMSWRHPYRFLGTPLLGAANPAAALGRMLDHALPRARVGMLALDLVGRDGAVSGAIEAAMAERGQAPETFRSYERATLVRRRRRTTTRRCVPPPAGAAPPAAGARAAYGRLAHYPRGIHRPRFLREVPRPRARRVEGPSRHRLRL